MLAKTGQIEKARTDAGWLIEKKPSGIDTERVQALVESLK
jgi:hypothetical protein